MRDVEVSPINLATTMEHAFNVHFGIHHAFLTKIRDIKEKVQRKWHVGVNKTKAIRIRCAVIDMVDGSFLENYN